MGDEYRGMRKKRMAGFNDQPFLLVGLIFAKSLHQGFGIVGVQFGVAAVGANPGEERARNIPK
jgi:hypothetical protein